MPGVTQPEIQKYCSSLVIKKNNDFELQII